MRIAIINKSKHSNPSYKTTGSSGMDIRADIKASIFLKPGERVLVPTGIFLEMPQNVEAQIRPRSGLAIKNGVTILKQRY